MRDHFFISRNPEPAATQPYWQRAMAAAYEAAQLADEEAHFRREMMKRDEEEALAKKAVIKEAVPLLPEDLFIDPPRIPVEYLFKAVPAPPSPRPLPGYYYKDWTRSAGPLTTASRSSYRDSSLGWTR